MRESRHVSHLFPPKAWGEVIQCANMGLLPEVLGLKLQTHFGSPPGSVISSLTDAAPCPAVQGILLSETLDVLRLKNLTFTHLCAQQLT